MRKPDFCLCENKGADQLRSNCETDQRLYFHYKDITIPPFYKSVSDLVANPEDRFSHIAAQMNLDNKNQAKLTDSIFSLFDSVHYIPLDQFW